MNPLQRLGPYIYSTLHSYNSIWELMLTRSESQNAARDADRLRERHPFLANYPRMAETFRDDLLAHHRAYTSAISPDPIAVSLELAVFLAVVCEAARPRAILDLGSGFSSYVFRSYVKRVGGNSSPVVYSIDQSRRWLDETHRFLDARELDGTNLLTWDEFLASDRPRFDLVLQDIADLGTRVGMINRVIDECEPGGMLVIDDMHVPGYRRAVLSELDRRGMSHFSLRAFTRKRLRYAYLVQP
jgi:predicted O-methyltransferase YrrM